jgi:hypothetical protein
VAIRKGITYKELKEVVLEPEKAVVMNGQLLFCLLNDSGIFDIKFLFWYMRYYNLKVTCILDAR